MQRDVHLQALRAAARVAFSVGSVASFALLGCGGTTAPETPSSEPGGSTETVTGTKDPQKTADKTGTNNPGQVTNPDREKPPAKDPPGSSSGSNPPPQSCEKVIADAFVTEGDYPGTKKNVSAEVTACCEKVLLDSQGMAPFRWDCCANVDKEKNQDIAIACTPWGPPVPPRMIARSKRAALTKIA